MFLAGGAAALAGLGLWFYPSSKSQAAYPFVRRVASMSTRWGALISAADAAVVHPQFALEERASEYRLKVLIPVVSQVDSGISKLSATWL